MRKRHSTWHRHEADKKEFDLMQGEIEESFKSRITNVRKEIFDFFDKLDYIIPWVEWDEETGTNKFGNPVHASDEEKMEYLKEYGCVYQRGVDLNDKNTPCLMLRKDAPELEAAYDRIITERNQAIEHLRKEFIIAPIKDETVELNICQKELDSNTYLSYFKYENAFDNGQMIYSLKELDVYYGSVKNDSFEEPKLEYACLEALIAAFKLKTEDNVPTREEWIRLFQNISDEKIREAGEKLASEIRMQQDEAERLIKDYLRSVRPVAKDLQETPDAIFCRYYWSETELEPKEAESLLIERAKKHAADYKGQLPPVL